MEERNKNRDKRERGGGDNRNRKSEDAGGEALDERVVEPLRRPQRRLHFPALGELGLEVVEEPGVARLERPDERQRAGQREQDERPREEQDGLPGLGGPWENLRDRRPDLRLRRRHGRRKRCMFDRCSLLIFRVAGHDGSGEVV